MVLLILFDSLSDSSGDFSACAFTCVTFPRVGFLEASPLLGSEMRTNPKPKTLGLLRICWEPRKLEALGVFGVLGLAFTAVGAS